MERAVGGSDDRTSEEDFEADRVGCVYQPGGGLSRIGINITSPQIEQPRDFIEHRYHHCFRNPSPRCIDFLLTRLSSVFQVQCDDLVLRSTEITEASRRVHFQSDGRAFISPFHHLEMRHVMRDLRPSNGVDF